MAKEKGEVAETAALSLIPVGSVIEFADHKHPGRAMLGVVSGAQSKAKGGARYEVLDAADVMHSVAHRDIHCSMNPRSKPGTAPDIVLKSFLEVRDADALGLGVDPELLELVWMDLEADGNGRVVSAADIVGQIDASLTSGALQQYRAFRILTGELGKIFFRTLGDSTYKAKPAKAVAASKDAWCRNPKAAMQEDFCFV
jgi:hypothetical protein